MIVINVRYTASSPTTEKENATLWQSTLDYVAVVCFTYLDANNIERVVNEFSRRN